MDGRDGVDSGHCIPDPRIRRRRRITSSPPLGPLISPLISPPLPPLSPLSRSPAAVPAATPPVVAAARSLVGVDARPRAVGLLDEAPDHAALVGPASHPTVPNLVAQPSQARHRRTQSRQAHPAEPNPAMPDPTAHDLAERNPAELNAVEPNPAEPAKPGLVRSTRPCPRPTGNHRGAFQTNSKGL